MTLIRQRFTPAAAPHATVQFLWSHYVELLTALTVLFILQTGLVPLDFSTGSTAGWAERFDTSVSRWTFPDVVSNIFLYLPFGILVHWSLCRFLRTRLVALGLTVVLAAALSFSIEWLQSYSPSRVSSLVDLVADVLGAALGASVSWIARAIVPGMVGATLAELHTRPRATLLKAYCLTLAVLAAVPFSFSLDRNRLKQSWAATTLVPFADAAADAQFGFPGSRLETSDQLQWRRMKRWSRWAAELFSFALLAWLMRAVLRRDYGFGGKATLMLIGWLGGVLAVFLSAVQLAVLSRSCDVTDILFRVIGLMFGVFGCVACERHCAHLSPALRARMLRKLATAGCLLTIAFILYTGLIPLTFTAGLRGASESLHADGFLPFFSYFMARFDLMMADAMEKFLSYALLAAMLRACWPVGRGRARALGVGTVVFVGLVISVGIEAAQMFIPARVASLTDPILACAGCLAGALGQRHVATFYRFALSREMEGGPPDTHPVPVASGSPVDALLATLLDPSDDAPVERVPGVGLHQESDRS